MDTKTPLETSIAAIELRAFAARKTMAEVCKEAGIKPQVWSRVKTSGKCSVITLRNVEYALDRLEA